MSDAPVGAPYDAIPPYNMQALLAHHVDRMLSNCRQAIEDLTVEELNHFPATEANSIGWDIWHVLRTADNVVFFVFDREQPVWLRGSYHERWGLPKVAQGTGMAGEEARGLRFPAAHELIEYLEGVRAAIVPRVASMTDDELAQVVMLRPWGERTKADHLLQTVIAHGADHFGRVILARALLGKDIFGF
jgi:hypothetical protein